MAKFNGDNYKKQYIDKPSEKIEKGEVAGRKRLLLEHKLLDSALAVNDEILALSIPASSIVVDAKIFIEKSLGATGIFSLGYKATSVDVADAAGFIDGADAGGQAVLKRAGANNAGIMKIVATVTDVFLSCTEFMDG